MERVNRAKHGTGAFTAALVLVVLAFVLVLAGCPNGLESPLLDIVRDKVDAAQGGAFRVLYDGNGNLTGTPPVDSATYRTGQTATVLGNTGSMINGTKIFAGWNTQSDGLGTNYNPGGTLVIGSSDITLYARWTDLVTYKVTYFGNGNTGGTVPVDPNNYLPGAPVTVLGNTGSLVRTSFTFVGWNTKADGTGITYNGGDGIFMPAANLPLYAKWSANPTYTVTYNANGATAGSVPVDVNQYLQGATVTVLGNTGNPPNPPLSRSGYAFGGWNTNSSGTGTNYVAGETFFFGTAGVVLYAKWVPYALRDIGPAGGYIFYDKGSYSDGWRYMEAAPSDQGSHLKWGTLSFTIPGADGVLIGTGYQNTIDIVNGDPLNDTAADVCWNLVIGTYSDWFMPSRDELDLMFYNLRNFGVGDFYTAMDGGRYISSSEVTADSIWSRWFPNGYQNMFESKGIGWYVRAARRF